MDICRTCLALKASKDIRHLSEDLKESKTCFDIFLFCLDIEVYPDNKVTTALCEKCYLKLLSFYKFKRRALSNDQYIRSLCNDTVVINEVYIPEDIKREEVGSNNNSPIDFDIDDIKEEIHVKEELNFKESSPEFQSDDEILSVLQKIKYENMPEDTKENVTAKGKKKRKKKFQDKVKQICEKCGKTVVNINTHMMLHMPHIVKMRYKCKGCEKTFASYSARYRHYKIKHLGIKEHCKECNKDVVRLVSHNKVVHNTDSLRFKCMFCNRGFISKSSLEEHILIHTKNRPHKCDICEKAFRLKSTLFQHKRSVHDKEKSHLCQFCSKSFFKKYHLQVHMRCHSKERPYKCNVCDKYYSSTTVLNNHKLIHSETKMFACDLCDMTFCKPGYLRNHMISHTKEKKFPCKYCGVKFGRSDHRLRHQRTAHERHLLSTSELLPAT